jgi:hypothetical protein
MQAPSFKDGIPQSRHAWGQSQWVGVCGRVVTRVTEAGAIGSGCEGGLGFGYPPARCVRQAP